MYFSKNNSLPSSYLGITKVLTYFLLFNIFPIFAQRPVLNGDEMTKINAELPNITPASPTLAALMKFEEIPVNNYTGIPDITLPIYTIPSISNDLSMNIALKYHPSSIQKDEFAGYTGLGWSLIAGGGISRTVRGQPDEIIFYGGSENIDKTRIGIYNNHLDNNFSNKFYQVMDLFGNFSTPAEKAIIGEFCWNAFEKGIFDSDHDLYQFNFMGKSGRFYIKKNLVTGVLEGVPLFNDQSIKIEVNYTFLSNKYNFIGFTIYDDKGYKYVFEDREITDEITSTSSNSFKDGIMNPNISPNLIYTSGFQLSRVFDNNGEELLSFSYTDVLESMSRRTKTTNTITPINVQMDVVAYLNSFIIGASVTGILPKQINTLKTTSIITKKLSQIAITNKGTVEFINDPGRFDTNVDHGTKLKTIIIKDLSNNIIKEFEFNYDYLVIPNQQEGVNQRLILNELIEKPRFGSERLKHQFFYKNKNSHEYYLDFDKWGYPINSELTISDKTYYEATGVLQKISYPTGGATLFEFGANTYSYIGNEVITDFSKNPENQLFETQYKGPITSGSNTTKEISLGINLRTKRYLKYTYTLSGDSENALISIKRKNLNGTYANVEFEDSEWVLLPGYEHVISFSWFDRLNPATLSLVLNYRSVNSVLSQYLKGGGIRINKIGYFDQNVAQDFYQNALDYPIGSIVPQKEKKYNYNFFNSQKTSGSLVFPEPLYTYQVKHPVNSAHLSLSSLSYLTTTDYNNLQSVRTHGSDVGYKNVTVTEKNNGKSEFSYRSPIDFPEENYSVNYPFIPSINRDYNRGQITKERHFLQQNNSYLPLTEIDYTYEIDSMTVVTGIRSNNVNKCPKANEFTYYSQFIHCLNTPSCGNNTPSSNNHWTNCDANYYLSYHTIYDSYGWSKLATKNTKNYFYGSSHSPTVLESLETYNYNPVNKKIASHTIVNSDQIKTDYMYHFGNSVYSKNRVSEISSINTYKNMELISSSKILYTNTGAVNQSFLPQSIQVGKGSNSLESKIKFNLYDKYSHPLEIEQESGIKICYVWGYNQTQPIAKIENANYNAQILLYVANLETLSNGQNEQDLIRALDDLRTALPNAMITTYTYKPLIGISTVTDPKGDRQTYHYDGFNRLQYVKDAQDNILSENKYHYKN